MTTDSGDKRSAAAGGRALAGRLPGRRTARPGDAPDSGGARAGVSGGAVVGVFAIAALIAALICAIFFGYRGYQSYFVERPVQQARQQAVGAAEQAMLNVTTIDPKNVADWKKRIDGSLTGQALGQVTQQDYAQLTSMVQKSGGQAAALTSRLRRSAPTEVNADEGKAKVLVYVDATTKRPNEGGVTQTMGFLVTMTRDGDDHWKASQIDSLDSIQTGGTGGDAAGGQAPTGQAAPADQAPAGQAPAPTPAPAPGGGS